MDWIKKIVQIPFGLFCSLLYLVSCIIPKDKNLWVFGAWFGKRYADNARYVFEFAQRDKNIKAVWISKDKKVVLRVRRNGNPGYLSYSLRGMYYTVRAAVAVVSSSHLDINSALVGGALKVHLWHGAPMKKLGYEDNKFKGESSARRYGRMLYSILLPHTRVIGAYDIVLASSDYFKPIMSSAFGVSADKVPVLGYPRNDVLFNDNIKSEYMETLKAKFGGPKVLGYFPTFRNTEGRNNDFALMGQYGFDKFAMETFLEETNSVLLVKLHYADQNRVKKMSVYTSPRIVYASEKDLPEANEALRYIDVLITDYSGIYFDYLLLNRPVIFAAFDLEEYISQRGLYDEYEFYLAGPVAKDWRQVIEHAGQALNEPGKYEGLRIAKNRIFNKYQDDKSSMRMFKYLNTYIANSGCRTPEDISGIPPMF